MPGTIDDLSQAGHKIRAADHAAQQASRDVAARIEADRQAAAGQAAAGSGQ